MDTSRCTHRTYYEFIKLLEYTFLSHPNINNFYTHKFKLESEDDIDYPAIVVTINSLTVGPSVTTASYNVMYVDRSTPERDNTDYVNSLGVQVITEIINKLKYSYDVDITNPLVFQFFRNQFSNACVGVFCTINIDMPSNIGECAWFDIIEQCC